MNYNILMLCPMQGNGGIASWTKKYLATFPDENYKVYPVNIAPDKDFSKFSGFDRIWYGLKALHRVTKEIKKTLKTHPDIQIMHITTGGGFGIVRDNIVARICRRHGVNTIMHCRFGVVKETYEGHSLLSKLFRNSIINKYNQVWVLDARSYHYLRSRTEIKTEVFLTPNSIEVPETCNLAAKYYNNVGFVGNILPTKGVLELVKAVVCCSDETILSIIGQGPEDYIKEIKDAAGELLGSRIKLLGRLPNIEAVKAIESLDIIALPTYYSGEAFPISILEAMSRGKLVISCPRAAIPDMLTAIDGSKCGILVPEHDSKSLADAISWCQNHSSEADEMCRKAYEKVSTCYRKEVVYDIYRQNYQKLLQ